MSRLSLIQKQKLGEILQSNDLLAPINKLLNSYGLTDIQATMIKFKPIKKHSELKPNFFPICKHGFEMVQNCVGGTCFWVCEPGHDPN